MVRLRPRQRDRPAYPRFLLKGERKTRVSRPSSRRTDRHGQDARYPRESRDYSEMATPFGQARHVPACKSTHQLGSGHAEPDLGMAGQRADRSGATQRNLGFSPGRTSARNGFPRLRCAGGPHGLDRSLGVRTIIIIIIIPFGNENLVIRSVDPAAPPVPHCPPKGCLQYLVMAIRKAMLT